MSVGVAPPEEGVQAPDVAGDGNRVQALLPHPNDGFLQDLFGSPIRRTELAHVRRESLLHPSVPLGGSRADVVEIYSFLYELPP